MSQSKSVTKRAFAPARISLRRYWPLIIGVVLIVAASIAWYAAGKPHLPWPRAEGDQTAVAPQKIDPQEDASQKMTVVLSPQRLAEAKIETVTVGRQSIQSEATVPARVTYDATRRLVVTAPLDCVVQDVLVQPGEEVSQGERLVILSSPAIGLARDQVARAKDDVRLAQREADNAEEVLENVRALLALLQQSPTVTAVLKQFADKRLGEHREHVLGTYSKMLVAKKAIDDAGDASSTGALSRRLIQQRQSDYEVAVAAFDGQRETTLFECKQQRDKAAAELAQQTRLLKVAEGRLRQLLGSLAVEESPNDETPQENLSRLVVVAAQGGRIEDHVVVKHQRLTAGDEIVTLSDTTVLWISANVHEQEWQATALKPGAQVSVRFPAIGAHHFTAKVRFVGSQVSQETRALPLVAEINNADGNLKPGMFAWVSLPLEKPQQSLIVPPSAVMRHENHPFVFLDEGRGRFRRVDVQLGRELPDAVEIVRGLEGGERIAVSGAFLLKSELLLEHEE